MNKPELKFALCGPHGSGKTTLLKALQKTPEFSDISFLPEITRIIQGQGFNINEAGTQDTQLLIMATHVQNLLVNNRFIVDRCLIDGLCYTKYLYEEALKKDEDNPAIGYWFMLYCEYLTQMYLPRYTKIFYIPAEIPLKSDGVRSTDSYFHKTIVDIFDKSIKGLKENNTSLFVTLSGSVEERVQTVLNTVRELDK